MNNSAGAVVVAAMAVKDEPNAKAVAMHGVVKAVVTATPRAAKREATAAPWKDARANPAKSKAVAKAAKASAGRTTAVRVVAMAAETTAEKRLSVWKVKSLHRSNRPKAMRLQTMQRIRAANAAPATTTAAASKQSRAWTVQRLRA